MMILAIIRRLPQLLELQRERTWQPLLATEMRDVTVGIVGLGSIGRAVAARALSFGSRVVAMRRQAGDPAALATTDPDLAGIESILGRDQLPELLAVSDMVVLTLPLTPDTVTVDAATLAHMKPGSWLINVARGGLVDERDLLRALARGHGGRGAGRLPGRTGAAAVAAVRGANLIITRIPRGPAAGSSTGASSVPGQPPPLDRGAALLNTVDVAKGY